MPSCTLLPDINATDHIDEKRNDVRVIVKVKNALILRKMEELGIDSVAELSRRSGIDQVRLGVLVNMKCAARSKMGDNEWITTAKKLASFFRCLPEDLFSESQQYSGLKINTASRDVSMEDIRTLLIERDSEKNPEQLMIEDEAVNVLNELLATLPQRHQQVLTLRFGLDGKGVRTLEEIAKQFGVCGQRVRQVEAEALRKMKHPSRADKIEPYLNDLGIAKPRRHDDHDDHDEILYCDWNNKPCLMSDHEAWAFINDSWHMISNPEKLDAYLDSHHTGRTAFIEHFGADVLISLPPNAFKGKYV